MIRLNRKRNVVSCCYVWLLSQNLFLSVNVFFIWAGITVVIQGAEKTLCGTVVLVPGDSLASCYLDGYKSPSHALRRCRFCKATSEDTSDEVTAQVVKCN